MATQQTLLETLVEMAKEIESEDPIDYGMLDINEDTLYNLIATSVLETYLSNDKEQREMIALATITKLVVENFVLQREKLLRSEK